MSKVLWEGRGQLEGWKVAMMGGRPVARFNGRLVAADAQPASVRAKVKAAAAPTATDEPKPKPKKPAAGCGCTTRAPAPADLLSRGSRKAVLFIWFAPARKPGKKGGGLRYVGGWPTPDASEAMKAAKAKKLPAGLLYICDESMTIVKTAMKAGE